MMAQFMWLALTLFVAAESQECATGDDCTDGQICADDMRCYGSFNASAFDSISLSFSTDFGATFDSSNDSIDDVIGSTGSLTVATRERVRIVMTAPGLWLHAGEIAFSGSSPVIYTASINGGDEVAMDENGGQFSLVNSLPAIVRNITLTIAASYSQGDLDINSIMLYGAGSTPEPSSEPTVEPTAPSASPTTEPTDFPSAAPSAAPTGFPTPDVCEEFTVTQSCCGNYAFSIVEDRVNLRDASLTTCENSFRSECCGTVEEYAFTGRPDGRYKCDSDDDYYYISEGQETADSVACNPADFDASLDDDVFGTVTAGSASMDVDPDDDTPYNCSCLYTTDECTGADIATCRSTESCSMLFDEACWANDTALTCDDDFSNETCWLDSVSAFPGDYAHLLWEPCSADSFVGSVTEIQYVSSEYIHEGDCTCTYNVRECRILEDPAKGEASCSASDCEAGDCFEEVTMPCCGYTDWNDSRNVVSPTLDEFGYPMEDAWTCVNSTVGTDASDLCPDRFDGSRTYTTTHKIEWFLDGETDSFESRCGCLYETNECDIPTTNPTPDPTADPTEVPTGRPTDTDRTTDSDSANMLLVRIALAVASLLALFI